MRYGSLSDHFTGIVAKWLSAVEADTERSNQHEFNGTGQLRQLLGGARIDRQVARFIWLGDENEGITDDAPVTWYDARERHPTRTEWRLYFQSNAVMEAAAAGDLLVVARRPGGDLMFIIAPNGSTLENQIAWLFGLDHGLGSGMRGSRARVIEVWISLATMSSKRSASNPRNPRRIGWTRSLPGSECSSPPPVISRRSPASPCPA